MGYAEFICRLNLRKTRSLKLWITRSWRMSVMSLPMWTCHKETQDAKLQRLHRVEKKLNFTQRLPKTCRHFPCRTVRRTSDQPLSPPYEWKLWETSASTDTEASRRPDRSIPRLLFIDFSSAYLFYLFIWLFDRESTQLLSCTRVSSKLIYICSAWAGNRE